MSLVEMLFLLRFSSRKASMRTFRAVSSRESRMNGGKKREFRQRQLTGDDILYVKRGPIEWIFCIGEEMRLDRGTVDNGP